VAEKLGDGDQVDAPTDEASREKIAPYCRRVLALAARVAIRSASPNRLHCPTAEGTGGG
jgi:hypothetical protein